MANFFKEMIRAEPHTLEEVRATLETDMRDHKQLIPLLKKHHEYLEESITVILDKETSDFQKQENLERFFRLFEMHAKAEEDVLYSKLNTSGEKEVRLEGFKGLDEHDLAFQLEDELTGMGYKTHWTDEISAKANVVAGLVKNHIKDEEDIMLPLAVSRMTEEELELMRDAYIQKCIAYLVTDKAESLYAGKWSEGDNKDSRADSFHH